MDNIFPTYAQFPMDLVSGHDWHIKDSNGKEYLDFTSGIGVCSFGYSNELIIKNVEEQVKKIWHTSNLYPSKLVDEVAGMLCPQGMLAFFCNSGTEANEAAFKLARKYTGKAKILAFNNGFHGRTFGSMSLTGNKSVQAGFSPLVPGVTFADFNDDKSLDKITDEYAAVILETIQGEGGVIIGDKSWIQKVAKTCHDKGVLLIVDEVQTGIGRTGTKFSFEHYDIHPDIITCAKALGNGLPVGAMLGKKSLASAFGPGTHGTTFGGNKLSMASAKGVLTQLTPDFLNKVTEKGKQVADIIDQTISPLPVVKKVSCMGLMIGITLEDELKVGDVIAKLQDEGLLTLSAGHNTLRLLPPLVMDINDLKAGLAKISEVLKNEVVTE